MAKVNENGFVTEAMQMMHDRDISYLDALAIIEKEEQEKERLESLKELDELEREEVQAGNDIIRAKYDY